MPCAPATPTLTPLTTRYQIAPQELVKIQRHGARKHGLDIVGFFHFAPGSSRAVVAEPI